MNHVVAITGASGGSGRPTAREYARRGSNVAPALSPGGVRRRRRGRSEPDASLPLPEVRGGLGATPCSLATLEAVERELCPDGRLPHTTGPSGERRVPSCSAAAR